MFAQLKSNCRKFVNLSLDKYFDQNVGICKNCNFMTLYLFNYSQIKESNFEILTAMIYLCNTLNDNKDYNVDKSSSNRKK